MTPPPRALVFDVGGVIVRWQPDELLRECFPAQAADAELVFQGHALDADWSHFDRGTIEPDALAQRIAARTGLPLAGVRALIEAVPSHLEPMPPSVALLAQLRGRGHRLALLSNMPRPYADALEARHDCFGWFEVRAWSGRLGLMKPQAAVFDHLQRALGIDDPSQLLFVDDHPANVEAARRCGWNALRFVSAAQCEADLGAAGWL